MYGTRRSPERETYGHLIAEIAESLGRPFLPHQRYMADVAMEIDPDTGLLAYSEIVLIGPRQVTGKTEWLLPMMAARCTKFESYGPQRVMYTAQTADEARLKWRDVHLGRLKKSRVLKTKFKPRLTTNKEAFIWRNGSMWVPGSTTGKTSGTGDTLDLGVIDEAWSRPDGRTELGMRPTMLTRRSSQLIVASMIPGISRALPGTWKYLERKRQIGRARVDADVRRDMAYFEWSAPEGLDPGDPATWWLCMPGLGRTVSEQKVRQDFDAALNMADFCAEYLGWAPTEIVSRWNVVSEAVWEDRKELTSKIAGSHSLALEIDEDRMTGCIVASGLRPDAHWHTEVLEPGQNVPAAVGGTSWMLSRTLEIVAKNDPSSVVIAPGRPANSLILPLRKALEDMGSRTVVYTPNTNEIAAACGRWYDRTGMVARENDDGIRLFHLGQQELDLAVGQAKKLDQGPDGAFVFVKRGSAANLITLYGSVLSMLGEEVHGGSTYDVLDSVDDGRPCELCGRSLYRHDGRWLHAVDDTPEC